MLSLYDIVYSSLAEIDVDELFDVITFDYSSPLTAERYVRGLIEEIESLQRHPEIYVVQTRPYFQQYGTNVRRLNYKKITIIYTIHADTVYIHRIIPAVSITGL